jgi:hypothetical protein
MADKSYIGKGKVHLNGRYVGNVSALSVAIQEEKKDLIDYTSAGGGNYNSLRRITGVEVTMTMHDLSKENLAMALYGSTSAVTAVTATDESISAGSDLATLIKTANVIDTSKTVTVTTDPSGTTYTEDTDYTVSAAGITPIATGSITASESLLITYDKKAVDVVQALTTSAQEFDMVLDGLNEAQSGVPVFINAFRAKFGGAQGLGFIGDEFAEIQLTGDILKDTTITGSGLSQYMVIKAA